MPFFFQSRSRRVSRWMVGAAVALLCTAVLAASPGLHEVYQAAEAGHVEQAQKMMDQVMRDHPDSAKAYYVRAELYARQGRAALAQQALAQAERLQPGLPFAEASAVQALRRQLVQLSAPSASTPSRGDASPLATVSPPRGGAGSWLPWLAAAGLALAAMALWRLRPRTGNGGLAGPAAASAAPYAMGGVSAYTPAAPYPYANGPAPVGGGLGASMAGGLATGVAVGAGVVAGQALMHRVLGNGDSVASSNGLATASGGAAADRGALAGALGDPAAPWSGANSDMGGADFGIPDGGSWDDGAAGGGDDWT